MKTKFTLIILVAASLAVGFLAGKIQASFSCREHLASYTFQRDAYSAGCYTQVLTLWQSGREDDARNALVKFWGLSLASLQDLPASEVSGDIRSAILQAKEYRAKYPGGEANPELELRIQRAFSLVQ